MSVEKQGPFFQPSNDLAPQYELYLKNLKCLSFLPYIIKYRICTIQWHAEMFLGEILHKINTRKCTHPKDHLLSCKHLDLFDSQKWLLCHFGTVFYSFQSGVRISSKVHLQLCQMSCKVKWRAPLVPDLYAYSHLLLDCTVSWLIHNHKRRRRKKKTQST